jgi:SdrD B-like protein/carboxypeptidase family protein
MKPVRIGVLLCGAMLCTGVGLGQTSSLSRDARPVGFRAGSPSGSVRGGKSDAPPPIAGSIEAVASDGAVARAFGHREDVYLAVGPTSTPCQFAAYLPDGQYDFQVTDASGKALLSTDPVSERTFTVAGGVIASYGGTTHTTGSPTACGSLTIQLMPFNDAGPMDALYIVWVTNAGAFDGNPTQVDPVCGSGCFHGFHVDASLTAAFRVEDKASCDPSFCVSGFAFNDANGNGVRDSGEAGLGGVPVRVQSAHGVVLTTVTAADGSFEICGLTSGDDFLVTSPAPLGFSKTGPANATIANRVFAKDFEYVIEVCESNVPNLTFPNQPLPGSIGGTKFEDTNANGVRDPGEPPLSGVTISLAPAAGGTPQTTTTDASGNFLFTNVAAGDYVLSETVPTGFTQTVPATGTIAVTLPANGSSVNNVFGNFAGVLTGTISGTKFLDANGNGVRDAGEPGMPGVLFTLNACPSPCAQPPVATTQSTADGSFTFTGIPLAPVGYFLSESVPDGFRQTAPPTGEIQVTVDLAHQTVTGLLFGNQPIGGTISGTKFNDANGNGVRDAGETGMSGVTIQLKTPAGSLVASTTTDASGNFSFTNVAAGQYVVSEVLPPGFVQTAPPAPGTIAVTATAGVPVTGLLFGNQAVAAGTGSISGIKYFDIDANGVVNMPPDRPLEGVTITLTDSSGHTQTAVSAADGTFKFSNLPAGTYTLSETIPPGFAQTFPGTPDIPKSYTITLTPGQQAAGFLFLNKC